MPAQEAPPTPKGPLSRQPGTIDVRMREEASPKAHDRHPPEAKDMLRSGSEVPLSRQPGTMDVRLIEAASPKAAAPSRGPSRELGSPRRANSAETPAYGRPRSLEARPKGVSTPELLASGRPGSLEAKPAKANPAEVLPPSRPGPKVNQVLEFRKNPLEREAEPSERGGRAKPPPCLEESSN